MNLKFVLLCMVLMSCDQVVNENLLRRIHHQAPSTDSANELADQSNTASSHMRTADVESRSYRCQRDQKNAQTPKNVSVARTSYRDLERGEVARYWVEDSREPISQALSLVAPNGRTLVTSRAEKIFINRNLETEEGIFPIHRHKYDVKEIGFSPDGSWLATTDGREIHIYNSNTWTLSHPIGKHSFNKSWRMARQIRWMGSGVVAMLLLLDEGGWAYVTYDVVTGSVVEWKEGLNLRDNSILIPSTGTYLNRSFTDNGTRFEVRSILTDDVLVTLNRSGFWHTHHESVSPNGCYLFISEVSGIEVVDLVTEHVKLSAPISVDSTRNLVAFTGDSSYLFTVGTGPGFFPDGDQAAMLWSLADSLLMTRMSFKFIRNVRSAAITPDGQKAIITTAGIGDHGFAGTFHSVFDMNAMTMVQYGTIPHAYESGSSIRAHAGRNLVITHYDGYYEMIDQDAEQVLWKKVSAERAPFRGVWALSTDQSTAVRLTSSHVFEFFDARTGVLLKSIDNPTYRTTFALSADGERLAILGADDQQILILDDHNAITIPTSHKITPGGILAILGNDILFVAQIANDQWGVYLANYRTQNLRQIRIVPSSSGLDLSYDQNYLIVNKTFPEIVRLADPNDVVSFSGHIVGIDRKSRVYVAETTPRFHGSADYPNISVYDLESKANIGTFLGGFRTGQHYWRFDGPYPSLVNFADGGNPRKWSVPVRH